MQLEQHGDRLFQFDYTNMAIAFTHLATFLSRLGLKVAQGLFFEIIQINKFNKFKC
jgi:hypothetical protein